jgi:hypothetical protein
MRCSSSGKLIIGRNRIHSKILSCGWTLLPRQRRSHVGTQNVISHIPRQIAQRDSGAQLHASRLSLQRLSDRRGRDMTGQESWIHGSAGLNCGRSDRRCNPRLRAGSRPASRCIHVRACIACRASCDWDGRWKSGCSPLCRSHPPVRCSSRQGKRCVRCLSSGCASTRLRTH